MIDIYFKFLIAIFDNAFNSDAKYMPLGSSNIYICFSSNFFKVSFDSLN